MRADSDNIKQIVVVIITAIVVSALSFVAQAALKPESFNPYLEDRKLINATLVDLKTEIITLKAEIRELRQVLRHANP